MGGVSGLYYTSEVKLQYILSQRNLLLWFRFVYLVASLHNKQTEFLSVFVYLSNYIFQKTTKKQLTLYLG